MRWLGSTADTAAAGVATAAKAASAIGRIAVRDIADELNMRTSVKSITVCRLHFDRS
jgi:hypothetical protein